MKTKLTKEEKEILASFEKGEWVPVKNLSKRKDDPFILLVIFFLTDQFTKV